MSNYKVEIIKCQNKIGNDTINYTVSCYLRKKPESLNDAIQLITDMRTLVSDLGDNDLSQVNLKAFRKMGEELRAYIDREIEISI